MTDSEPRRGGLVSVVLADANILYSRVLRDYLLYAASEGVLQVRWSRKILIEMVTHLIGNNDRFDDEAAQLLISKMNDAFPLAEVIIDDESMELASQLELPDPDDIHVLAAAIATSADLLCTNNLKDFPTTILDQVGIEVVEADALLGSLMAAFPEEMKRVHFSAIANLPGASTSSSLGALRRAGAIETAKKLEELLRS